MFPLLIRCLLLYQLSQTMSVSLQSLLFLFTHKNIAVQHVQHAVADTMNELLSRNVYYMVSFVLTILYFLERFYSLLTLMYSMSNDSTMKSGKKCTRIYIGTKISPVSPGNIFVLRRLRSSIDWVKSTSKYPYGFPVASLYPCIIASEFFGNICRARQCT